MLQLTWVKVLQVVLFYFGIWLLIPLMAIWWALRDAWVRNALIFCAFLMTGLTQVYCYCPHYAAPGAVLIFVLVVAGLRQLWVWRRAGRPVGRALVWGIALGYPVLALLSTILEPAVPADATHVQRAALLEKLRQQPGQQLVLVQYLHPKEHGSGHEDWVWNAAAIDASQVVWARAMNPDRDKELLAYYPERRAWLLEVEVDKHGNRLTRIK
jgi:hypothetical protein